MARPKKQANRSRKRVNRSRKQTTNDRKRSTKRQSTTRKKRSKHGSATRGWKNSAPRRGQQRRVLKKSCGKRCSLQGDKFPICNKCGANCSCKPSCKGMVLAKIRARQYGYTAVANKADRLIQKYKCSKKASQKTKKGTQKNKRTKKKSTRRRH